MNDFGIPRGAFQKWLEVKDYDLSSIIEPKSNPKPLKNKEIPLLKDYKQKPSDDYWSKFPQVPLPDPSAPRTPVNADAYERLFLEHEHELLYSVRLKVRNTIHSLRHGFDR